MVIAHDERLRRDVAIKIGNDRVAIRQENSFR